MTNALPNAQRATSTKSNKKTFAVVQTAAQKASSNDTFEKRTAARMISIKDSETQKAANAMDGLACWYRQGQELIAVRLDWVAQGGDNTSKTVGKSFKSFINSQPNYSLSDNDRGEAVWIAENWSKVSTIDLSEQDLAGLSVNAIKKKIKEALQTPAEKNKKAKTAADKKTAKEAQAKQAKSDTDELQQRRDGTFEDEQTRLVKCPIEYANIVCAKVTLAFKTDDVLKFIDQCNRTLGLMQNANAADVFNSAADVFNAKDITPKEAPVFELTVEQVTAKPKAKRTRKTQK